MKHCADFLWFVRNSKHCEKSSRFSFVYRKMTVRHCLQTVERIFYRTLPASSYSWSLQGKPIKMKLWNRVGCFRCVRQYPACSRGTEPTSLVVPTVQPFFAKLSIVLLLHCSDYVGQADSHLCQSAT